MHPFKTSCKSIAVKSFSSVWPMMRLAYQLSLFTLLIRWSWTLAKHNILALKTISPNRFFAQLSINVQLGSHTLHILQNVRYLNEFWIEMFQIFLSNMKNCRSTNNSSIFLMKHKSLNFDDAGKIDVFVPGVPGKRKFNYQITDVLFHFIHNVAFYEVIQLIKLISIINPLRVCHYATPNLS